MGNQIKFSPKKKDEQFSGNDDCRSLEIKNIELKNTNRKLIAKIDQQKSLIKSLANELESLKSNQTLKDCEKLKKNHQTLEKKHNHLQETLKKSESEVINLKKDINKLTGDSQSSSPWNRIKNRL